MLSYVAYVYRKNDLKSLKRNCIDNRIRCWMNPILLFRYGNLTRLIKDGCRLQSWPYLKTKVTRCSLWLGHPILEGIFNVSFGNSWKLIVASMDHSWLKLWILQSPRPYEIIAVATWKGIAIWHVNMSSDSSSGHNSSKKVALLSDHDSEVCKFLYSLSCGIIRHNSQHNSLNYPALCFD